MERITFICECHSLEHQLVFWYDKDDDMLYCEPHLITHRNFFKRLIVGLKYAFGYKSRYGNWDETIFKPEDVKKLRDFLNSKDDYNFKNNLTDKALIELYGLAYNDGFENIGDSVDIIKHRDKQIRKIKNGYFT